MVITFEADVENGVIKIPKELIEQLQDCKHLRVTVTPEESGKRGKEARKPDFIDELMSRPPWFEGRYLTRDEIYDRNR